MSTAVALAEEVRLHWSRWFHCESSFNLALVPNEPGIFAIAEEVVEDGIRRKVALNVVEVKAAEDLFHALSKLYSQDCPVREKLEKSRCFLRYAAVEDAGKRAEAVAALGTWLEAPGETDSPYVRDFERIADPGDGPFRAKGD